jgi:hypothetical protein
MLDEPINSTACVLPDLANILFAAQASVLENAVQSHEPVENMQLLLPILIGEPLAIIARGGNLGYIFCLKLDQTGRSTGPS